jgi:hypothetical protein
MGSGHFLVSLVDYLADRVLEEMEGAAQAVPWRTKDPYVSPLKRRIDGLRRRVKEQAEEHGWAVSDDHLDDRHIVRRIILKRVIYGVDKNPMAVELAKLSLWLHTFTVGAPLSFLDHHLQCGDSLFGEWVRPVEDELREGGHGLFINSAVAQARNAARGMGRIEEITDADVGEVHESAAQFAGVLEATEPLARFLDVFHALRWNEPETDGETKATAAFLDGQFGDPVKIASGVAEPAGKRGVTVIKALLAKAHDLAAEERFFHWETTFPGVWRDWESAEPEGGFDAVIGNPPWDRTKLQQVEWFAARREEIALQQRASDRKRMIAALERDGDPLWIDFKLADARAKDQARVARTAGQFPLLAHGDINIYSLLVERALRLIKPAGIVGLLVPSGIASDKSASRFFSAISGNSQLAALFDFENRKIFFPDVNSRFKFSVFVAGGKSRRFPQADCAFFLHRTRDATDPSRSFVLSAADFAAVNPNTGTAPVFRSRRDAELTTDIYGRVPVLVDRRNDPPTIIWPVRYTRMFDMTNDSGLFKRHDELISEGFYPVEGGRLKRGEEEFLPLYTGRTIHQFDHRAASVKFNPNSLHNPFSSDDTSLLDHQDPSFSPRPQFWVAETDIDQPEELRWTVAFRNIARATDARTFIATIVPHSAAGNTLPLMLPVIANSSDARSNYAEAW